MKVLMESWRKYLLTEAEEVEMELREAANTLGADVNEILMGYYAGGENWNIYGDQKGEVLKGLEQRKAQISPEEYADQAGRAKAQAEASLEWAAANGFDQKRIQRILCISSLVMLFWECPLNLPKAKGRLDLKIQASAV